MTGYASSTPLIIANVGPTQPSDPVAEVLPVARRSVAEGLLYRHPGRGDRRGVAEVLREARRRVVDGVRAGAGQPEPAKVQRFCVVEVLSGSAGEWSSRTALCAVVADPVRIGGTQLPRTAPDRDFVGE